MKLATRKNSIERYAQIGKISHELFHDILNPITGLILYLEVLNKQSNKILDKNQIEEVKNSSDRVRIFLKIIQNNLLNPERKELININREIKNIVSLSYYKAKNNNVSITYISNTKQEILIQKISFYQLIMNLISNSIDAFEKVNDDRKRKVIVKAEEYKDYFKFSISDNGCGITKKDIKKIFKNGFSNKKNGFGIGLKSVKRIIKNNKGEIVIKSSKNKGTNFIIKLPSNH